MQVVSIIFPTHLKTVRRHLIVKTCCPESQIQPYSFAYYLENNNRQIDIISCKNDQRDKINNQCNMTEIRQLYVQFTLMIECCTFYLILHKSRMIVKTNTSESHFRDLSYVLCSLLKLYVQTENDYTIKLPFPYLLVVFLLYKKLYI